MIPGNASTETIFITLVKLYQMTNKFCKIKKINQDEQIVYAEVHAPFVVDAHGDMFFPQELEKMSNDLWERMKKQDVIDVMHDEKTISAYPIESFIAKGHEDYTEGAWVLGVKINDPVVWQDIKKGRLNGYSMSITAKKKAIPVDLEIKSHYFGITEEAANHTHMFFAFVGDDGTIQNGRTTTDFGHDHGIGMGTATEEVEGHSHRFNIEL